MMQQSAVCIEIFILQPNIFSIIIMGPGFFFFKILSFAKFTIIAHLVNMYIYKKSGCRI